MKLTFNKYLPEDFSVKKVFGFIYCITNLINSKVYIGQTTTLNRVKRYINGKCSKDQRYIYNAIQKYGKDNFSIEIIDCVFNLDILNFLEKFYISTFQSNNREFGYNIREGGRAGKLGKESIEKMKVSLKGRSVWNKGKTGIYSKESLEKNKIAHTGICSKRRKKVLCINTGEIFTCRKEALIIYPNSTKLSECCLGNRKYAGKLPNGEELHWKYI